MVNLVIVEILGHTGQRLGDEQSLEARGCLHCIFFFKDSFIYFRESLMGERQRERENLKQPPG